MRWKGSNSISNFHHRNVNEGAYNLYLVTGRIHRIQGSIKCSHVYAVDRHPPTRYCIIGKPPILCTQRRDPKVVFRKTSVPLQRRNRGYILRSKHTKKVTFLSKYSLDWNNTISAMFFFLHNTSPISLYSWRQLVCETLPTGGLRISPQ
jgi:hypothetical protein